MQQHANGDPARPESQPGGLANGRRKEGRAKAEGEVQLYIDDPEPQVIPALLVDVSKSGFRARYQCPSLGSGSELRFRFGQAHGKARVMWSCVTPELTESGFLILP
jgi:hypothetical protein